MNTIEYLDKCKEKLEISSTYALAKAMNIDERVLSNYKKERVLINEFVCFRIAQILDLDPAYVIADIKSGTEKDEVRREFFKSFVGSAKKNAAMLIMALCLSSFINAQGSDFKTLWRVFLRWMGSHNVYYVKSTYISAY